MKNTTAKPATTHGLRVRRGLLPVLCLAHTSLYLYLYLYLYLCLYLYTGGLLTLASASIDQPWDIVSLREPHAYKSARLLQPALLQEQVPASPNFGNSKIRVLTDTQSLYTTEKDTQTDTQRDTQRDTQKDTQKDTHVKHVFAAGTVKIYRPALFASIRAHLKFSLAELAHELTYENLQCLSADSKSGQAFWRSSNGRVVLKTIKHYECKNLLAVSDALENHYRTGLSSIAGVLGVFRVQLSSSRSGGSGGQTKYFIACSNVYSNHRYPSPFVGPHQSSSSLPHLHKNKYDLKGSTVGRLAKPPSEVLKDLDLIRSGRKLGLGPSRQSMFAIWQRDAWFLSQHGFMDYSLLVASEYKDMNTFRLFFRRFAGLTPVISNGGRIECIGGDGLVYHFGIIDFLQKYTFRKWLETLLKGIFSDASKISCVPPKLYAQRFVKFLSLYSE